MYKKIIALCVGGSMMLGMLPGYADEQLSVSQEGTQTVVLSGCLGSENANVIVCAEVYSDEYIAEDLRNASADIGIMDMIRFHDQAYTDKDGNYEFRFDLSTGSEWLTPYIGTDSVQIGGADYRYMYIDDGEWREAAEKINSAAKSQTTDDDTVVSKQLNDNVYVLGFTESEVKAVDTEGLANVILNTVADSPLVPENRDESWITLRRALTVQMLNEEKIQNIYSVDEKYRNFEKSDICDWYDRKYITDSFRKELTDRLSGEGIESFEDYKELLTECFILTTISKHNGVDNVENILKDFEDLIGIDTSKAKDSIWSALAGEYYEALSELKNAFNSGNKGTSTSKPGGGSSGGGGGSSSGGFKNTVGDFQSPEPVGEGVVLEEAAGIGFSDISDEHWAKNAVGYLAQQGIVTGVGENRFDPDGEVTREQFAKLVVGAFAKDAEESEISFIDVEDGEWYTPYIKKAYGCGIVNGISETEFGTGVKITRQDMCVMIYRAAKSAGYEFGKETSNVFADDSEIADYAREAVYALCGCGAVNGMGDNEFCPNVTATRAQAAKIIYSLIIEM